MTVESEEPYLLIHEKKLSSRQPMLPVLCTALQDALSVRSPLTTTEAMIAGKKSAAAAPVRLSVGMDF
jgi:chaperonin GroEL (HSP60 family)